MRRVGVLCLILASVLWTACQSQASGETLYGDGGIGCPNHWADDQSTPVGTVEYLGVPEGVQITVTLTDAAPDHAYYVEVNLEDTVCDTWEGTESFSGLVTDAAGKGKLEVVYAADPGPIALNVNVVCEEGTPPNPLHREMGPAGFTIVEVPGGSA